MRKEFEIELKVGLFVTIGVGLIMLAVLMLGGTSNLFQSRVEYRLHFSSADGLITGAKVVLGGLTVGTVESVDLDPKSKDVAVIIQMDEKYAPWIRQDSQGEIATQGLLGDKFVAVTTGSDEEPAIPDGGEIAVRDSKNLNQFINKGDELLVTLNSLAKNLDQLVDDFKGGGRSEKFFKSMTQAAQNISKATDKDLAQAVNHLNGILTKIDNGTGTLGALVNDASLYDDLKLLLGGANRNRIIRNLVRKTIKDGEKGEEEEQAPKKK